MTPLEKKLQFKLKKMCCNCNNLMLIDSVNYCRDSGKIILEMHLDSDRKKQCELRFK